MPRFMRFHYDHAGQERASLEWDNETRQVNFVSGTEDGRRASGWHGECHFQNRQGCNFMILKFRYLMPSPSLHTIVAIKEPKGDEEDVWYAFGYPLRLELDRTAGNDPFFLIFH